MADTDKPQQNEISKFRCILPQVIATAVTALLLLDVGISLVYSAVVVSALSGLNVARNPGEELRITPLQASWLGSVSYIAKLLAGLFSGWISEPIGRKKAMILINVPHLIAWILFYKATSIAEVFAGNFLLGFGAGFVKATSITYIGEISQASIRGVLISSSSIATTISPLIVFVLGTLTAWRNIALCALVLQIMVTATLFLIPESPMWLLSNNRDEDALNSLKWLRGWKITNSVETEFQSFKRYKEFSQSCSACAKKLKICDHRQLTTKQKLNELVRKRTIKPFIIFGSCAALAYVTGTHHLMTYLVPILNAYKSSIEPNLAAIIVGFAGVCGTVASIFTIKFLGKRKLFLCALAGTAVMTFSLSFYGFYYLPPNSKSYEHKHINVDTESATLPLILFAVLRFFTSGTMMVPFTLLGELFPLKVRSLATGIMLAMNNIIIFGATKTFYDLEKWFNLPTAFSVYCAIGVIGFIISYKILPETEGRTLEDIEVHFSDNSRKLTDRFIQQMPLKSIAVDSNRNECSKI